MRLLVFTDMLRYACMLQVDFFEIFRTELLPFISVPIILVTGQWFVPHLKATAEGLHVLNHPMVAHWFSQNPVYDHPKYSGLIYGIAPWSLQKYSDFLLQHEEASVSHKPVTIANLPVSLQNSPWRAFLPQQKKMPYQIWLQSVARALYVLSPVGDRPDTYRHLEAIGLGTVPLCDCPQHFKSMYRGSMQLTEVEDMLEAVQEPAKLPNATHVHKNILLASYWKAKIEEKRLELKTADLEKRKQDGSDGIAGTFCGKVHGGDGDALNLKNFSCRSAAVEDTKTMLNESQFLINSGSILVYVYSQSNDKATRDAIRKGWAKGARFVFFIVSTPGSKWVEEVDLVGRNDVIFADGLDNNLSRKWKAACSHAVVNFPNASWLFRVGDGFQGVQVDVGLKELEREFQVQSAFSAGVVHGQWVSRSVLDTGSGLDLFWPANKFWDYPNAGVGWIASRRVAEFIHLNSEKLVDDPRDELALGQWMTSDFQFQRVNGRYMLYCTQRQLSPSLVPAARMSERKKLMLVAHPDDEVIFAGSKLLEEKGEWEIMVMMDPAEDGGKFRVQIFSVNSSLALDSINTIIMVPDTGYHNLMSTKFQRSVEEKMQEKAWDVIMTHSPKGEYGHPHHKQLNKFVTAVARRLGLFGKLCYFDPIDAGRFGIRWEIPQPKLDLFNLTYDDESDLPSGYQRKWNHRWNKRFKEAFTTAAQEECLQEKSGNLSKHDEFPTWLRCLVRVSGADVSDVVLSEVTSAGLEYSDLLAMSEEELSHVLDLSRKHAQSLLELLANIRDIVQPQGSWHAARAPGAWIRHPQNASIEIEFHAPICIANQSTDFECRILGLAPVVQYQLVVTVSRTEGREYRIVFEDKRHLETAIFDFRIPPLDVALHTIRVSVWDRFPNLSPEQRMLSTRMQHLTVRRYAGESGQARGQVLDDTRNTALRDKVSLHHMHGDSHPTVAVQKDSAPLKYWGRAGELELSFYLLGLIPGFIYRIRVNEKHINHFFQQDMAFSTSDTAKNEVTVTMRSKFPYDFTVTDDKQQLFSFDIEVWDAYKGYHHPPDEALVARKQFSDLEVKMQRFPQHFNGPITPSFGSHVSEWASQHSPSMYFICYPQGGWNDMMSIIWKAYQYCLSSYRLLIVDTTKCWFQDELWHYFTLNLPLMYQGSDVSAFITQLLTAPSHTVFPKAMHGKRSDEILSLKSCGTCGCMEADGIGLSSPLNKMYTETVLVYSDCGSGDIHEIMHHFTMSNSVRELFLSRYYSLTKPVLAVHIRNTDYVSDVDDFLHQHLDRLQTHRGSVFVASDHAGTVERLRKEVGANSKSFSCLPIVSTGQSIHDSAEAKSLRTSMNDIRIFNKDLIVDFFLLASADDLIVSTSKRLDPANQFLGHSSGFSRSVKALHRDRPLLQSLVSHQQPQPLLQQQNKRGHEGWIGIRGQEGFNADEEDLRGEYSRFSYVPRLHNILEMHSYSHPPIIITVDSSGIECKNEVGVRNTGEMKLTFGVQGLLPGFTYRTIVQEFNPTGDFLHFTLEWLITTFS